MTCHSSFDFDCDECSTGFGTANGREITRIWQAPGQRGEMRFDLHRSAFISADSRPFAVHFTFPHAALTLLIIALPWQAAIVVAQSEWLIRTRPAVHRLGCGKRQTVGPMFTMFPCFQHSSALWWRSMLNGILNREWTRIHANSTSTRTALRNAI